MTIIAQPSNSDTIYITAESTNGNTIDTLLFVEVVEFLLVANAKNPEAITPIMAEKDKKIKRRKISVIVVNLHISDTMEYESLFTRKIEYGIETVFNNYKCITSIIFEFALKKNQINVFKSYKNVFTAIKMMDNTTEILLTKENLRTS